jgi:ATP adenylyltransferase
VFCEAPSVGEDAPLVVHRGRGVYVLVNRFPYNSGHIMVLPYRHVPALGDLSTDELHELIEHTQQAEAVLRRVYTPAGINVGINLGVSAGAGLRDHLHLHVVPRWAGDTNFISVVGDTRVLPEDLTVTVARLRDQWTSH